MTEESPKTRISFGLGTASQELVKVGIGSFACRITEVVLGTAVAILLARLLGPSGYGLFAFFFAVASFSSVLSRGGLSPLLVRETARGEQSENWAEVKGIWWWAHRMAALIAISISIFGLVGLGSGWVAHPGTLDTVFWGMLLIPVITMVGIKSANLMGLRHFFAALWPDQILRPALLAFFLALVLAIPDISITPGEALALALVSTLAAYLALSVALERYRPIALDEVRPRFRSRLWLSSLVPMALTQGFQQINRYADVLLLGFLSMASDVGVYRVAAQGALLVSLGLAAFNMVVGPISARLYASGQKEALQNLMTRVSRWCLSFAVIVMLAFTVLGEQVLRACFGPGFSVAYLPLIILSVGQVVSAWVGVAGTLLNMAGFEKDYTFAVALAGGINVFLNVLLIPAYGPSGAAVATVSSVVFWNFWIWRSVKLKIGIRCSAF